MESEFKTILHQHIFDYASHDELDLLLLNLDPRSHSAVWMKLFILRIFCNRCGTITFTARSRSWRSRRCRSNRSVRANGARCWRATAICVARWASRSGPCGSTWASTRSTSCRPWWGPSWRWRCCPRRNCARPPSLSSSTWCSASFTRHAIRARPTATLNTTRLTSKFVFHSLFYRYLRLNSGKCHHFPKLQE